MSDLGTTAVDAPALVRRLRVTFSSGRTRSLEWRRAQLRALRSMLVREADTIGAALRADLGKSPTETHLTETGFVINEIDHTLRHLKRWLRPQRVRVPVALQLAYDARRSWPSW